MANPFTTPTISNYNTSPPSDDGSATAANEITWAKHKTKLADPVKTFVDSVSTNITTAFTRIFPFQTGAITATYTLQASDRGKMLTCSNTFTLTLLPAATAAANFVFGVKNTGSGTITIDGDGSETIDGATTLALDTQYEAVELICDGSNWHVVSNKEPTATLPRNYIGGLNTSTGTDTDHDIDIAVGEARDATNAVDMVLASTLTKQIDAAWAVGTNAGGLDGTESVGGTPDASTMYYVWLIKRSDTGVVDALFSESATVPTMPTDYDYKRLIGAVLTDGSANIIGFTQVGDYFRYTGDVVQDVSDNTITSLTYETGTLSVPPSSLAHIYAGLGNATTTNADARVFIRTKDAADDTAVDNEAFFRVGGDAGTDVLYASGIGDVLVNSSSQIEYTAFEGSGIVTVTIKTFGFTMFTRRDP